MSAADAPGGSHSTRGCGSKNIRWSDLLRRVFGHTATSLSNGNVLVAGGWGGEHDDEILSSTEIYKPASESFAVAKPLAVARVQHTATLLRNGRVLIAGGRDHAEVLASAELF